MRHAGYDIGISKVKLIRLMAQELLQIKHGTPDLKDAVPPRSIRSDSDSKGKLYARIPAGNRWRICYE